MITYLFRYHTFFFFNDTATTEIYTLSLHDALPISIVIDVGGTSTLTFTLTNGAGNPRSEEHTSELQSLTNLVCRLLLEKKKKTNDTHDSSEEVHKLSNKAAAPHDCRKRDS